MIRPYPPSAPTPPFLIFPSVCSVCSVVRSPGERPYPVGQSSKGPIKRSAIPGPLPSFSAHIFAICGPSAGCRRVVSLPAFSV